MNSTPEQVRKRYAALTAWGIAPPLPRPDYFYLVFGWEQRPHTP